MRDQHYSPNYAGEIALRNAVIKKNQVIDEYLDSLEKLNDMEVEEYVVSKGYKASDSNSNYLVARVLFIVAAENDFYSRPYQK